MTLKAIERLIAFGVLGCLTGVLIGMLLIRGAFWLMARASAGSENAESELDGELDPAVREHLR